MEEIKRQEEEARKQKEKEQKAQKGGNSGGSGNNGGSGGKAPVLAAGANATCAKAAGEVLGGRITVNCLYFRSNNGSIQGTVIGGNVFY
ncbi:MAG: hypothetical protein OSJ52_16050 [Lachnospiraceae bacterium]|nr:hypothetical protein [Lachnospiraceae bacterium]